MSSWIVIDCKLNILGKTGTSKSKSYIKSTVLLITAAATGPPLKQQLATLIKM